MPGSAHRVALQLHSMAEVDPVAMESTHEHGWTDATSPPASGLLKPLERASDTRSVYSSEADTADAPHWIEQFRERVVHVGSEGWLPAVELQLRRQGFVFINLGVQTGRQGGG